MEYKNSLFFDEASHFYNNMIDAKFAIDRKRELFNKLKISNNIVADLGCGTGNDSIALAKNGCTVDAFDSSAEMINYSAINAKTNKVSIKFFNFPIHNIPKEFNNKYSFICSLGNTFANITPDSIFKSFNKVYSLLEEGGRAIIHILNYDLILRKKERIINISAQNENHYIRFYDFEKDYLNFNILQYSTNDFSKQKIISTKLYPYTFQQIFEILNKLNANRLEFFGDFAFNQFDMHNSKDLIILLEK